MLELITITTWHDTISMSSFWQISNFILWTSQALFVDQFVCALGSSDLFITEVSNLHHAAIEIWIDFIFCFCFVFLYFYVSFSFFLFFFLNFYASWASCLIFLLIWRQICKTHSSIWIFDHCLNPQTLNYEILQQSQQIILHKQTLFLLIFNLFTCLFIYNLFIYFV